MLVGWRYIGSNFTPLKQNILIFTTSFREEMFHSKSLIRSFQEWVWFNNNNKQNNKFIKGCGGASDLPNKVDDSPFIC